MDLENQKKLYNLFKQNYLEKKYINKKEIIKEIGFTQSTINKYFLKIVDLYIKKIDVDNFEIINFIDVCETDFLNSISQSKELRQYKQEESHYKRLKQKSYDQFCIAIEIYNKPILPNKMEVFSILLANAWELILKAKFIKNNQNIYFNKDREETMSMINIVRKEFTGSKLGIKDNLECLIKIRDKATHDLINLEIEKSTFSRMFQAAVINYINFYEEHFGNLSVLKENKGMLSIVIDSKDEQIIIKNKYLENEIIDLNNFVKEIELLESSHKNDSNFIVSIDYRLKFADKNDNEITIKQSPSSQEAIIIEKEKNIRDIYKYDFKGILNEIQQYLLITKKDIKFNKYNLNKINKKFNLQEQHMYCSKNALQIKDIQTTKLYYTEKYLNFIKKIINNEKEDI